MDAVPVAMDAMDAVALGARVQQVADKLSLKEQEARTKGNVGAAHALAESVSDLRHAAAVLVEQKRLLTVRQTEATAAAAAAGSATIPAPPTSSSGDVSSRARLRRNSSASSIVSMLSTYDVASVAGSVHSYAAREPSQQQQHELVARLARVEKMLGKKSDEMRAKGNETASHALQQSAAYVRAGSACISEQQHSLSALTASHDALSTQWRALAALLQRECKSDNCDSNNGDNCDSDNCDTFALATAMTTKLAAWRAFVQRAFPDASDVDAVDAALQREREAFAAATHEREQLQQQVAATKKLHAEEYLILREDIAILQRDKAELEEQLSAVERDVLDRSARELAACQRALDAATAAREQLVETLAARDAQIQQLEHDAASAHAQSHTEQQQLSDCLAHTQRTHAAQLAALEEQLAAARCNEQQQLHLQPDEASAADTVSSKVDDATIESDNESAGTDDALTESPAALQRATTECAKLQAMLNDCEQRLESERARSTALDAHVAELERRHADDVDALQREHALAVATLEQQRVAADADANALQEQLATLEQQCAAVDADIGALREELTARAAVEHELTQAVDAARHDCELATQRADEQQQTLVDLQTDVQTLQTSLDASVDAAAALASVNTQPLSAACALQLAIAAHLERAAAAHNRLAELEASERTLSSVTDTFLGDVESLFAGRNSTDDHVDGVTDSVDNVATDSNDALRIKRLDSVKAAVASALQDLATLQQTLATERDAAAANAADVQQQVVAAHDLVQQLTQRNDTLTAELAAAIEHAAAATAQSNDSEALTAELARVTSDFERYRLRSHAALKQVEKRAERLNAMRKANATLTQELAARDEAAASADVRIQSLREQLEQQQMQVQELEQRLTEQAATSDVALAAMREQLDRDVAAAHADAAADVVALRAQVTRDSAALAEHRVLSERMQQELADAQAARSDAETTLVQRMAEAAAATAERTGADAQRIAALESEVAALESQLQQLRVAAETAAAAKSAEPMSTTFEFATATAPADSNVVRATNDVRDDAIRELRRQVRELTDQVHAFETEHAAREHERESSELAALQTARQQLQTQRALALPLHERRAAVAAFTAELERAVDALTRGIDDHARAFRDACEFRDAFALQPKRSNDESSTKSTKSTNIGGSLPADAASVDTAAPVYHECLVFTSGVVIKAGARFELPVVCATRGWRVVWTFAVKEDGADIGFALLVTRNRDAGTSSDKRVTTSVVAPQRVHELSGVFTVDAATEGATLAFEWDNAFSWLNEKTLDYHVSIHEPETVGPVTQQMQSVGPPKQSVVSTNTTTHVRDGLALLAAEAASRQQLVRAVAHLQTTERDKDAHVAALDARTQALADRKAALQQQMTDCKAALASLMIEQDALDDAAKTLNTVWRTVAAERDDAETTLHLVDSSQLETLKRELQQELHALESQPQEQELDERQADTASADAEGDAVEVAST